MAIGVDDEDEPDQVFEADGTNTNTDLDNLDDGPKRPDVEQFASMLREAQHLTVQIKKDEQARKRKTPKTYQGNSKKTQYRRQKARKALASKGFLDIGSFMALKRREEEAEAQEAHESADSDMREIDWRAGGSAPSGTPGLPVVAVSGRTGHRSVALAEEEEESSPESEPELGADEHKVDGPGGSSAPSGTLGLTIPAVSGRTRRMGRESMVVAEEEEEGSPGSEPEPGAHWHMREVDWRSQGPAPSKTTGSSVTGGANNEDSYGFEDDEEHAPSVGSSARESLGVEGGYGDEGSNLASSQDAVGSLSSGPEDDLDSLGGGLGGGNSDGKVSAQAGQETLDAKCTLNKILEALHCGQDPTYLTPNTPFDRALDLWKDRERLGQACTSLTAKM